MIEKNSENSSPGLWRASYRSRLLNLCLLSELNLLAQLAMLKLMWMLLYAVADFMLERVPSCLTG